MSRLLILVAVLLIQSCATSRTYEDKDVIVYARKFSDGSDLKCFVPKTLAKKSSAEGSIQIQNIAGASGSVSEQFDQILKLTPDQQEFSLAMSRICLAFGEKAIDEKTYQRFSEEALRRSSPGTGSDNGGDDWNDPRWEIARNHISWVLQDGSARKEYNAALQQKASRLNALKTAQARAGNGGKGSADGVDWITKYGEARVERYLTSRGE